MGIRISSCSKEELGLATNKWLQTVSNNFIMLFKTTKEQLNKAVFS